MNRLTAAAVLFVGLAAPASASVKYDFVETGTKLVGATLTFNSPPASPTQAWTVASAGDVLEFRLLDANAGTIGVYTPTLRQSVVSSSGATLDSGTLTGLLQGNNSSLVVANIAGGPGASLLVGTGTVHGTWTLETAAPPAVPEPSAMGLALVGGLAVATLARLRRGKTSA